ncbi:Major facilitator superfamily MFS_1 [Frankia canadensis]|uniref:Major facilitator superfamily MFS_1 n=1 Tax=Frankia canadensis TaxID=1836972 RepID=A0A2I2L0N7_9ACTN|nr:MFS transporter [Frankia canadensis]SNQ51493.1 Major facilitator superfamily MFS_1 [Frankia canadensis]SOU58783.1 Major facilitator superfamily MFS_1 [Frankia canadensis]
MSATTTSQTERTARPDALSPGRAMLPVVLCGTAMVVLDIFIVNAAIPEIERDFHTSASGLEWLVTSYNLAFAAGMATSGRLGDCYGRRRVFAWGLVLFVVMSLLCGLANDTPTLVAARTGQGLAAAALVPQVTAIINLSYSGAARARAYTAYALTLGGAAVSGQVVGGALIAADPAGLGWRSCFLVNVPIGAAALLLTWQHVPPGRMGGTAPRLDLVGAVLVTAALVAVVLPLVEGPNQGWPGWIWGCAAAAVVLIAVLVPVQRRTAARGDDPILPAALFAGRGFSVGLVNIVLFFAGVASWFFVLALYLQDGRHLSPLGAGLVFSALGGGFLLSSLRAARVWERLGRQGLALGAGLRALGLVALWVVVGVQGTGGQIVWIALPLAVDGLGQGLVNSPLIASVLLGLRPEVAGAGSGLVASAQQVGNSLGVAGVGAVYFAVWHDTDSVAAAFRVSLLVLAALSVVVVGLVQLLPNPPGRESGGRGTTTRSGTSSGTGKPPRVASSSFSSSPSPRRNSGPAGAPG